MLTLRVSAQVDPDHRAGLASHALGDRMVEVDRTLGVVEDLDHDRAPESLSDHDRGGGQAPGCVVLGRSDLRVSAVRWGLSPAKDDLVGGIVSGLVVDGAQDGEQDDEGASEPAHRAPSRQASPPGCRIGAVCRPTTAGAPR